MERALKGSSKFQPNGPHELECLALEAEYLAMQPQKAERQIDWLLKRAAWLRCKAKQINAIAIGAFHSQ
jgi:hypothetical protein